MVPLNSYNVILNSTFVKIRCFTLILTFVGCCCWSQNAQLLRRVSLGVALEVVPDFDTTGVAGVYITAVMEESTAQQMGLKPGDVLTRINGVEVADIQQLLAEVGKYREGDHLTVHYYRNKRLGEAEGIARPRAKEQSDVAEVHYGSVAYSGYQLRTILHLPKGKSKPPLIYFIQGYPCQSIDLAFQPQHPTRKLVDDWVKAGFAVYRIEKPGMGDSEGGASCFALDFEEEVAVFRTGYRDILSRPDVDTSCVFLFGHSIGGIIAPLLASEFEPKGVITYGTVINSWFEYMQELTRVQGVYFNQPDTIVERDIRNATPFWYALLVAQKSKEEILKDSSIYYMLEAEGNLQDFQDGQFIQRHYTYWTGIQNIHLSWEWANVKSNVLALYGEFDIQALHAEHIYAIERIVNTEHPGNATAKIIAGADHGFVRFGSMSENVAVLNSNQYGVYRQTHYHEGIATHTIHWINQQLL